MSRHVITSSSLRCTQMTEPSMPCSANRILHSRLTSSRSIIGFPCPSVPPQDLSSHTQLSTLSCWCFIIRLPCSNVIRGFYFWQLAFCVNYPVDLLSGHQLITPRNFRCSSNAVLHASLDSPLHFWRIFRPRSGGSSLCWVTGGAIGWPFVK